MGHDKQHAEPRTDGGFSRRGFLKGAAAGAALTGGVMLGTGAAASAVASPGRGGSPPAGAGDLSLVNGKFVDARGVVATALSIKDGRIASVGQPNAGGPARTINLRGRTVIPGLIDSHAHFSRTGTNPGHEARDIETAFTFEAVQEVIAARAETAPAGEFITCRGGWNRLQFPEQRLPTKAELDEAAPQHPVYLQAGGGGGGGATNSLGEAFFTARGIGVNEAGEVSSTGAALSALTDVQTDDDKLRGTRDHIAHAASTGVTGVHDTGNVTVQPEDYRFMRQLHQDGGRRLDVRMRFNRHFRGGQGPAELEAYIEANHFNRIGDDTLRIQGVGEQIVSSINDFEEGCRIVARHGWTLHQHVLSEADHNIRIPAVVTVGRETDISHLRWNITHLLLVTEQQLEDLKSVGVGITSQNWRYLGTAFGPPFRMMVDSGMVFGAGTDSTNVAPFSPWLSLFYMITGRSINGELTNDGQQLSRLEALRSYTVDSAWFSFEDHEYGTFEVGKVADLAVLTDDYLTVSDDRLRNIKSLLTLQGGRVVHARDEFADLA